MFAAWCVFQACFFFLFYVTGCIATMKLPLRRTLVRPASLLGKGSSGQQ